VTATKPDHSATSKTFYAIEVERIAQQSGLPQYQYMQIRQSKDFMEQYYAEKIELNRIALAACMSRFHFIRLFQLVYGTTPRQFLKDLRINKAKVLIKEGLSVTQVCFEVGYESLPTFSSAFKKGTGCSPKEYQLLHKSNPE
jgi:AraC-like DNA-binding protein